MARTELPNGVILPAEYSDDWYEDMTSNLTKLDDVIGSDSEKLNSNDVAFLRMSSAALTDGGTGNFSDLNSSNKLKTGDYVLDSGRKLYQVVSVDSTNETFTVGNSLFKITAESDLAPVAESGDYDDLDNKPDLNPYDQHIVNTDIHVTTADKAKWNNNVTQSYVFRYSGTAITDNSTIAYSTIDNTDNIKSGDKILDVDGKLFEITAVDTTNQTVTVGSALIDLALDANVVHTSGNETVGGIKTFNSNTLIYNSDNTANTPNLILQSSKIQLGDTTNSDTQSIVFNAGSSFASKVESFKDTSGTQNLQNTVRTKDTSNNVISAMYRLRLFNSGFAFLESGYDNTISLGRNNARWKDCQTYLINGLTPSSLGMPTDNIANIIDISGYLTVLDGSQANTYQAPSDGYIGITMSNCTGIEAFITGFWGNQILRPTAGALRFFMPICKNMTANILVFGGTVDNARFFPCQGNI